MNNGRRASLFVVDELLDAELLVLALLCQGGRLLARDCMQLQAPDQAQLSAI